MASEKLFGASIPPACKYCEHVLQIFNDSNMLCEKRGAVDALNKCRNFIYDPLKRVPQRPKPLEKIDGAEFEI